MKHRKGIMDGLVLIAAGLLLLAGNFNMLPTGFWWAILEKWPVIFILAGLDVMASYVKSDLAAWLLFACEVLVLVAVIWIAWTYPFAQAPEFLQYFPFMDVLESLAEGFGITWSGS
ncbi:MAG: DUF5668 domain-containing protein [Methanolobus sp.]|uniref:LiaI-LiaF-like domain-containing protein n=1 Tax=Methanolobus sp. TaxID=1874737 RepID=UPI00272F8789|nr:DUF5668 domain-containing protein [Methanolobus sp.]MDP2217128.1 DUF5668 domain-containing protein [Methanolobus sp.]